jgi:hypothetical protein
VGPRDSVVQIDCQYITEAKAWGQSVDDAAEREQKEVSLDSRHLEEVSDLVTQCILREEEQQMVTEQCEECDAKIKKMAEGGVIMVIR